jgi:hypothetical protein
MQDLSDFQAHLKEYENGHQLDLSSSEDLSIALMNLISIEEHLYFTAQKTTNSHFYQILASVRQIRKTMQAELVKDTEGEVWCFCKHLLAATMRLMETGNKVYAKNKDRAQKFYHQAYELYNLFWLLNLKLVEGQTPTLDPAPKTPAKKAPTTVIASTKSTPTKACQWKNFSTALNKNLDCCHE